MKKRTKIDAYYDAWRLGGSLYQPRFLNWLRREDPEAHRLVLAMIEKNR